MKTEIDDYWQELRPIARLPFPPQNTEHDVSFLWHQAREQCGYGHREIGIGTFRKPVERVYVHAKAVFFTPQYIFTFSPTPPVPTDLGQEIGYVDSVQTRGAIRHEIGKAQGWYYEQYRDLMLWEVLLYHLYAEEDPTQDFLLITLWQTFEQELLKAFPDCQRIITPGSEPKYDDTVFRKFLAERGYVPHQENTFIKIISTEV